MPQLGETVAEGTVTAWLKQVGDRVEQEEALVEIATDKVDTEVPSPASGVVVQLLVDVDQTVLVGTPIAVVQTGGAPIAQPRVPRHRASPRLRRHASELGIDVGAIAGTGPGGRVTFADLPGPSEPDSRNVAADAVEPVAHDSVRRATGGAAAGAGLAGFVTNRLELHADPTDRRDLVAACVVDTLAALRRYVPVHDVLISTSQGEIAIAAAADLTPGAISARIAEARTERVHATLRVIDADEVISQVAAPRGEETAVLTIGRVTERLVPRGQATFALRATATVTLAYTVAISDAEARQVLMSLSAAPPTVVS